MMTADIEDIYELSPLQKGILFHCLYAPEEGLYFIQFSYRVRGTFNIEVLQRVWQRLAARHTVLRTSFYWEEIDKPLQVVHRQVNVPLEQEDWRGIDPSEQSECLNSFLTRDRQRGFDFSQAPLMRMTVIRLGDESYQIVWSKHHLILDGWSGALVMGEFSQLYQAFCQGKDIPFSPGISFKTYISWLRKQELSKAERYWRQVLSNVKAPTPLGHLEDENLSHYEEKYDEELITLSATTTKQLQTFAQQYRLTLNTLFQGTWALLLSRYSGQKQVVYGCGVSGRPVDLEGTESMVGVFINTLPVCVNIDPEQALLPWLKQLQDQLVEMRQYEYSPLVEVQGWSHVARGLSLFETIVVFENYPSPQVSTTEDDNLESQNCTGFYKTNYPLNVIGHPGSELGLGINYDCRRFESTTIQSILAHFEMLLQQMIATPELQLKDLSLVTSEQRQFSQTLAKEMTFAML
ncbi:MAG: non-ribosomal peptide synthetase [Leptolyngbyaceae cyanobacterium SM1_4_3]|nr:non-ribosomal peptide synthetase [Leptolyngbyaceae cyanobacterium SM1_4_3]